MVDNRSREMLKAQENTISGGKFLTDCRVIKIHAIYIYMYTSKALRCSRYARAQGEAPGSRKPPVLGSNEQ